MASTRDAKVFFLLFGYLPETNLLELRLIKLKWGKKAQPGDYQNKKGKRA